MRAALSGLAVLLAAGCVPRGPSDAVERGQYLVAAIGCGDCHTPGGFTAKPDTTRRLAGSDAAFVLPGVGVFVPPNLTPDKATGLGNWSEQQIVTAITRGVAPDGRVLSPAMPWSDYAHLTTRDAMAIAAYLKSLPAITNKVPAPAPSRTCAPRALQCIVER